MGRQPRYRGTGCGGTRVFSVTGTWQMQSRGPRPRPRSAVCWGRAGHAQRAAPAPGSDPGASGPETVHSSALGGPEASTGTGPRGTRDGPRLGGEAPGRSRGAPGAQGCWTAAAWPLALSSPPARPWGRGPAGHPSVAVVLHQLLGHLGQHAPGQRCRARVLELAERHELHSVTNGRLAPRGLQGAPSLSRICMSVKSALPTPTMMMAMGRWEARTMASRVSAMSVTRPSVRTSRM